MASKSPAFQFYPQDYLASARVAEMTLEEEGVYIRLLCYCWSAGSIPRDPERCAKLAGKGCSVETATAVQRSFNEHPTDSQRLVHDRLDIERENQRKRREQAAEAGKESAKRRKSPQFNADKLPTLPNVNNDRSTVAQQNVNPSSSSSSSSSSNIGETPGVVIPATLNDSECIEAAKSWMDYMDAKGLQDKSPRYNDISLQAWWRQMAKFGRDKFLEAVEQSMSRGKWNVELHDNQNSRARKEESQDWVLAVKVAKAHPSDWKKRQELLPADVFEALKRTGSKAVAEGNSYELRILKDIFYSHLKDASSGITASN